MKIATVRSRTNANERFFFAFLYPATLAAARRLERHKCSFDGKVDTASECMKSEIGTRNESHFFVATQDKDLQKYLSKVRKPLILW